MVQIADKSVYMTVNKTWGDCITIDLAKRWVFMQKVEIATHPCKGRDGIRTVSQNRCNAEHRL
ncbi:hypothetical protein Taro_032368 [Colocasia esculenta]|uniref:Uncharacterized protein n=1 Tax=Colocasia esculenta TaxID=4460 RepID=A0A843W3Q4_COLES|nr:hypothetical protein [Colocasia esculenta]